MGQQRRRAAQLRHTRGRALHVDDPVELVFREGEVIIRRPRPQVRLDDLLARFDPDRHRHEPILDSAPAGRESR